MDSIQVLWGRFAHGHFVGRVRFIFVKSTGVLRCVRVREGQLGVFCCCDDHSVRTRNLGIGFAFTLEKIFVALDYIYFYSSVFTGSGWYVKVPGHERQ
jgi:hypothetical protein